MTLVLKNVKTGGAKKDLGRIPDGTYPARIAQVVDFGIQPQTDYQTGAPTESKPRLMITFEVPSERIKFEDKEGNEVDRPRWIGKEYTISTFEKSNLMKLVQTLKPDAASFDQLLDLPCLLSVGSTKTGNAKVTNVMQVMAGVEVPELENPATYFDFDVPDQELYMSLPRWQREKIKEAENYSGFADTWLEETDEDLPF